MANPPIKQNINKDNNDKCLLYIAFPQKVVRLLMRGQQRSMDLYNTSGLNKLVS